MLKNIDNGTLELVVPQLHTLLGMVNRLQQHNKSLMTDAQATEMYVKWLKPAGIGKAPYFAGTYEGNLRVGQRVEHPEWELTRLKRRLFKNPWPNPEISVIWW